MTLLHKLFEFDVPREDLINIYTLYIRSVIEQSCVVWHSSLTNGEKRDMERVQKVALRIIMKEDYDSYPEALEEWGLKLLSECIDLICT